MGIVKDFHLSDIELRQSVLFALEELCSLADKLHDEPYQDFSYMTYTKILARGELLNRLLLEQTKRKPPTPLPDEVEF